MNKHSGFFSVILEEISEKNKQDLSDEELTEFSDDSDNEINNYNFYVNDSSSDSEDCSDYDSEDEIDDFCISLSDDDSDCLGIFNFSDCYQLIKNTEEFDKFSKALQSLNFSQDLLENFYELLYNACQNADIDTFVKLLKLGIESPNIDNQRELIEKAYYYALNNEQDSNLAFLSEAYLNIISRRVKHNFHKSKERFHDLKYRELLCDAIGKNLDKTIATLTSLLPQANLSEKSESGFYDYDYNIYKLLGYTLKHKKYHLLEQLSKVDIKDMLDRIRLNYNISKLDITLDPQVIDFFNKFEIDISQIFQDEHQTMKCGG